MHPTNSSGESVLSNWAGVRRDPLDNSLDEASDMGYSYDNTISNISIVPVKEFFSNSNLIVDSPVQNLEFPYVAALAITVGTGCTLLIVNISVWFFLRRKRTKKKEVVFADNFITVPESLPEIETSLSTLDTMCDLARSCDATVNKGITFAIEDPVIELNHHSQPISDNYPHYENRGFEEKESCCHCTQEKMCSQPVFDNDTVLQPCCSNIPNETRCIDDKCTFINRFRSLERLPSVTFQEPLNDNSVFLSNNTFNNSHMSSTLPRGFTSSYCTLPKSFSNLDHSTRRNSHFPVMANEATIFSSPHRVRPYSHINGNQFHRWNSESTPLVNLTFPNNSIAPLDANFDNDIMNSSQFPCEEMSVAHCSECERLAL